MSEPFIQDPDDKLDYELDYTDWLGGDTIIDSSWAVTPSGPTLSGQDSDDQVTVCWIEGLVVGTNYLLTNLITTSLGRKKERSINILCRQQ